jgi:hypothetical protein
MSASCGRIHKDILCEDWTHGIMVLWSTSLTQSLDVVSIYVQGIRDFDHHDLLLSLDAIVICNTRFLHPNSILFTRPHPRPRPPVSLCTFV